MKLLYKLFNYEKKIDFKIFNNNCNTDNLCRSLPGHNLSVPWYENNKPTADILNKKQVDIFLKYIN